MGIEHVSSSSPSPSPAAAITASSKGEGVIVVTDANHSKGSVDALDWALKNVVRPRDTVLVLGVMYEMGKKASSCFPFHMGISFAGIWERLEFSRHSEMSPRELEEEIERKREQYQSSIQPFYRQCKRNEVKLEIKLAGGYEPRQITVEEAQNFNTRWIVLDSHLRKERVFIYEHVGCNVAVMKGKDDVATLMPSKRESVSNPGKFVNSHHDRLQDEARQNNESSIAISAPDPPSPCWYPISWRTGFPRSFSKSELDKITNSFAEENIVRDNEKMKVYQGILQETPVLVKHFSPDDEQFWTMVKILSRVRHRNIMNLVGYCCTETSMFFLCDYPCMGTLESNLQCDESAKNLTWNVRWNIAQEIGGSLRYLHEESVDGPIAHLSVCSSSVAISHGFSAMLGNFTSAKRLNDDVLCNEGSPAACLNLDEDGHLSVDIRDYGMFLVELLSGKTANAFQAQDDYQKLVDWALPLLDTSLIEVMDPRLEDASDARIALKIARAAFLCLKNTSGHRPSMSEVLAKLRGDQFATSRR